MTLKKLKYSALAIVIFLITLELSAVLANDFFFEKVAKEEVQKRSLPKVSANAIKHTYAASLVYSGLRNIYFSSDKAKNITIFLGKVNELAELAFKSPKDSTLEMMKDLENNLIGICAARWLEENSDNPLTQDRLDFIGILAEKKYLIISPEEIILLPEEKELAEKSSNYSAAVKWFSENEPKLSCAERL